MPDISIPSELTSWVTSLPIFYQEVLSMSRLVNPGDSYQEFLSCTLRYQENAQSHDHHLYTFL